MPAWLASFLVQLITPIVQKIIDGMMLQFRLDQIQKKQDEMHAGFLKMAAAEKPEEIKDAIKDLADSWNR